MIRSNEFGEEISEKELTKLAEDLQELEDSSLDLLWKQCGYIMSNKAHGRVAISQEHLDEIRDGDAKEALWNMLNETPLGVFRTSLVKHQQEDE
jgi:hypothetical protein